VRPVKPDVVVRTAATDAVLLAIDTKWKVPSSGPPTDDDLKQMFVYNELLAAPHSVLLYPKTAESFTATGAHAAKRHACSQRHLDPFEGDRWSTSSIQRQLAAILSSGAES
jgi:5-methylcytosine-specific restriction endonuclease McrBC regulatory subunit McrC